MAPKRTNNDNNNKKKLKVALSYKQERATHISSMIFFLLFHCFSEVLVLSYEKSPSEVSLHNELNFFSLFSLFFP